jgi:hypothetical protein
MRQLPELGSSSPLLASSRKPNVRYDTILIGSACCIFAASPVPSTIPANLATKSLVDLIVIQGPVLPSWR